MYLLDRAAPPCQSLTTVNIELFCAQNGSDTATVTFENDCGAYLRLFSPHACALPVPREKTKLSSGKSALLALPALSC